jgi:phosphate transport system protein
MVRRHFEEELDDVRSIAGRMAALVEEAIRMSMESVLHRRRDLADEVVNGDTEINHLHLKLREEVFTIISTQAPVASDLRLLIGCQYIGAELERMGDYAVRIAKRSRQLTKEPHGHPSVYVELREMGELVEQQVHDILDAFIATDKDAAVAVAERDDAIDRLYRKVFAEQLSSLAEGSEHALGAQYLLNIAHTLERLADRVTNVAEDIVFLATGDVVELK